STFALFTRASSSASVSAERRASTVARADTRFQYAAFTSAVVCTSVSRSRVSAMARFTRLVASCWRDASTKRSRTSGCDTLIDSPDCSSGLKLFRKLLLSVWVALHDAEYDVPNHGTRCVTPA